jgi:Gpi18-like mannosyltransferase
MSKRPLLWASLLVVLAVSYFRLRMVGWGNHDVDLFIKWIAYIEVHGPIQALRDNFANYPPAYLYFLSISTFLLGKTSKLVAIKAIPLLFDVYAAFIVYKIARLRFPAGDQPYLLAAIFWGLPTIMINGSGWGQVDMLYTAFLLTCVFFLLKDRPFWALVAFGVAFSFKSQSIFLLPCLGLLFLKGRIRWYHFLLVPLIYVLLAIPAALIGRPWADMLLIYVGQVSQFRLVSMNAPNLYIFFNDFDYETGVIVGMVLAVVVLCLWASLNLRSRVALNPQTISLLALTSVALVPFILPKMHDRYFFPADVLSFAVAVLNPELWFIPILYQLISGTAYTAFLLGAPMGVVMLAAIVNTVTLIYLLWKQYRLAYPGAAGLTAQRIV